jgi:hypothetical protein
MSTLTGVIIADFTTTLATAISIGGTTATLSTATDDDGVALPTGRYFFTIDGSNSSKEHISCTLTGTSLTNIKTVSRQGVETAGTSRVHRIGASVSITDFAHILQVNNLVNGTTNLNAAEPLEYDGTATINSNNQLATKAYVDGVAISGAADSSTSVKGIGRVSVAPVSAGTPIFVGDNDGRVPTQAENDALVGTSGTPSTSNKYVTNDDTTATPTANKVVRYNSSGEVPPVYRLKTTAICAETLAVGDPVASYFYQADGGVTFDAKATNYSDVGVITLGTSLTVANQTNRTAIVIVYYSTGSGYTCSGVTFDSVAMTAVINNVSIGSSRYFSVYRLVSPNVGASRTVTATFTGSVTTPVIAAYNYYNTDITTPGTSYAAQGGATNTITPAVNGSLALSAFAASSTIPSLNSNDLSNTSSISSSGTDIVVIGDSGIAPNTVSFTSTATAAGGIIGSCYVVVRPVTAPTFGYAKKTSASSTTNAIQANLYSGFLGFVTEVTGGGVLGQVATIQTDGVVTGLSGLQPLSTQYLANTAGTLSDTAGTNSKKVGFALTATTLLVKQDN